MGPFWPDRASMGPDQQSWDFLGHLLRCRKPGLSCARGLLAVSKPLSRNSKNAMVAMRLSFLFAHALQTFFDLPRRRPCVNMRVDVISFWPPWVPLRHKAQWRTAIQGATRRG
jgi:hypothetical protein